MWAFWEYFWADCRGLIGATAGAAARHSLAGSGRWGKPAGGLAGIAASRTRPTGLTT